LNQTPPVELSIFSIGGLFMSSHISENELLNLIKELDKTDSTRFLSESLLPVSEGENNFDGTISVKRNKIIVNDPKGMGLVAIVIPVPPLVLYVNGVLITGETPIRVNDEIKWSVPNEHLFSLSVSEDRMQAIFKKHARERYEWCLKDVEKSNRIFLEVIEKRDAVIDSISFPVIMASIKDMGIDRNLNYSVIYQELQEFTGKPIVFAVGKPPKPGIDARLEFYFREEVEKVYMEVLGVVDYRDHLHIPSAKKGEIIGRKFSLVEGEPGYDVFGAIIQPKHPKDISVIAEDNVQIDGQGQIIALREGRPRITGTTVKFVEISTVYVISGNVDMGTGHIVFSGDVVVYGDVTENMIIESLGNVYVQGNVFGATITATESIIIRGNIMNSRLYSGYFGVIYNRLFNTTSQLLTQMMSLTEAAKTLMGLIADKEQQVNPGRIMLLLLESKFTDIPKTIKEILTVIANIHNIDRESLLDLKDKLEWFLHPLKLVEIDSMDVFIYIQKLLEKTCQSINRMQEISSKIDIQQCHLSVLKSNGDIQIRREGVLKSDLYSKNNIVFYEDRSVCRGSRLEADGIISAMNVGGQTCSGIYLKSGKKIVVKNIHSGRVCIGKYCRDIFESLTNTTFDEKFMKKKPV
jgi:Icc-related predicted phosphoesterase